MPNIENRSRFTVTVKHRPDLYREFRFNKKTDVRQYASELRAQGFKPVSGQLEDAFLIRIREKGYPVVQQTFASLDEAETAMHRILAERKNGLFVDYTKSHRVTFEDVLVRYMKDEGPRNKGWDKVEKYKCQGWLEDLRAQGPKVTSREEASNGIPTKARGRRMRTPTTAVQWMRKPFAAIQTLDIRAYIDERLKKVMPATVDREVDILRAIFSVATKTWKYRLSENPFDGLKSPSYCNERDRRLKLAEERAILAAAYDEDVRRSVGLRVEELVREEREASALLDTIYAKKNHMKEALRLAHIQAERNHIHIPLYETFISFQLMTAARRGEALKLKWTDIDFERCSAYLAETKNGRPRSLPLRQKLSEMLQSLPRLKNEVFGLSEAGLRKVWSRIIERSGVKDFRIHDLRHEAISRVAETSKFSLVDLQKFSGHRDVRMLLRYAHLCTTHMAHKLDEAFSREENVAVHHGQRRLKRGAVVSISELANTEPASNVISLFRKNTA